jgi:hypothetical protein
MKGRTREPKEGNMKLNNLGNARTKLNIWNLRLHVFHYLESRKTYGEKCVENKLCLFVLCSFY